ncbi:hypothetical protein MANES_11G061450v8 [Manihot esculenta]|uniref:Uncharacterized protein n=1 Tax=Manihot esculenta TaxID=3983 RepID=A0ACB7GTV6_MANES|nr:hypothetical protein MANES_11G061450v8 [Manihot esculenta]
MFLYLNKGYSSLIIWEPAAAFGNPCFSLRLQ